MTQRANSKADEFYVGYLPLPASYARMLRVALPAIILACALVAVLLGVLQRGPGAAVWGEDVVSVRGTLLDDPYPLVLTPEGHVVLLVEQGKHGARGRVDGMRGKVVVARGLELGRDGRTILELLDGSDALAPVSDGAATAAEEPTSGTHTLTLVGEVIDSKCYHGAMKPGDGKAHKACATLCVGNGIPAMFIDESGAAYLFSTGGPTPDQDTLSKIGERVRVTGEASVLGDMRVLRVAPGSVQREAPRSPASVPTGAPGPP